LEQYYIGKFTLIYVFSLYLIKFTSGEKSNILRST